MVRNEGNAFKIFCYIFCFFLVVLCAFPLIWMVLSSFKLDREVWAYPVRILPRQWLTKNYVTLFGNKSLNYASAMMSTGIVAVSHTILTLFIETAAAYAYARLDFPGKKILWRVTIFTMFIPNIAILLTSFVVVKKLGMLNTLSVLIVPSLAGAYGIFFYRQFFLNIPLSMEEAALIDGASRIKIYWTIFLPNARAPMVLLGTGCFIACWNSFVWPSLTIMDTNLYQVMQVIRSFRNQYTEAYGVVMAASVIGAIPPLILFMVFQRDIVKGMLISGIK